MNTDNTQVLDELNERARRQGEQVKGIEARALTLEEKLSHYTQEQEDMEDIAMCEALYPEHEDGYARESEYATNEY